jgi:ribulose bisphosphate carboxylase small subunit
LLNRLELLDTVKEDPTFAKIIFVVPQGMGSKYKTQQIETEDRSFLSDLDHADCTRLSGIDPAKKRRLAELGIHSHNDLKRADEYGDPDVNSVNKAVEQLRTLLETPEDSTFLSKIPHYVLEIEYVADSAFL